LLDGRGAILDVARIVSRALVDQNIPGAVIGGVAVVLHGHVRTTLDVDVWVPGTLDQVADALKQADFSFDASRREFKLGQVPVHLISSEQTLISPSNLLDIEQVRTVSLADLINLKLSSGTRSVLRSQDIADIIGLIRANQLSNSFVPKIAKPFRKDFRKLVNAVGKGC
jgi:hypothetical protein